MPDQPGRHPVTVSAPLAATGLETQTGLIPRADRNLELQFAEGVSVYWFA
jgi:hypothetical protein